MWIIRINRLSSLTLVISQNVALPLIRKSSAIKPNVNIQCNHGKWCLYFPWSLALGCRKEHTVYCPLFFFHTPFPYTTHHAPLHVCLHSSPSSSLFTPFSFSPCSLTEHGRKYKASIFIRVSERHPVSLLLGNTGVSSRSFRLADHSCTRGSRLLWLYDCHRIAQISLTNALHLKMHKAEKRTWIKYDHGWFGFLKL